MDLAPIQAITSLANRILGILEEESHAQCGIVGGASDGRVLCAVVGMEAELVADLAGWA